MELYLGIITVLLVLTLVILIWFVWQRGGKPDDTGKQSEMLLLSQRMDSLIQSVTSNLQTVRQEMQDTLLKTNQGLNQRLDKAAEVVGQVQNKLGQLDEASKRIFEVGKDIASLQDILKAPKQRGNMGELFLGDLLAQVLPKERFQLQYAFKSGEKVDAVIFLKDRLLVPVDAKFPLENFKRMIKSNAESEKKAAKKDFIRDVKKHIDAIAQKYILTDEGTLDFALMYIVAENVYYETVIKDEDENEIYSYAFSKKVIPVSPNNFYVYLQTVLMGLKGMQIEKNVKEILNNLARLQSDFEKFKEDYLLVGKHLGNARSKYEESERRLDKFGEKLLESGQGEEEQQKLL